MSNVAKNPVNVVETNGAGQAVEQAATQGVSFTETLKVCNAKIFPSEEDGVGATIKFTFTSSFDGYRVNRETHLKEKVKLNYVSFFLSEVIKKLASDFIVGSWLKTKDADALSTLLPVVLMGSTCKINFAEDVAETKMLKELNSITLPQEFTEKMKTSVLDLI